MRRFPDFRGPALLLGALWSGITTAAVELKGVSGALRDNVLAQLALDDAPCDVPEWRLRRLRRDAEPQIRAALEAYGRYEPRIEVASLENRNGCWRDRILVEPGEPVRLRSVRVDISGEAASDEAFRQLLAGNPLRPGDVLNHAKYERYKRALQDLARRQGYFAARFTTNSVDVWAKERVADVDLELDSGPRYRFGDVRFEQSVVDEAVLRRLVSFERGKPYDGEAVADLYDSLLAAGWFGSVDLRTEPGAAPDLAVPITVTLSPARRHVYVAGAGYSTDTGLKVRGGYTNHRVNRRGHQLEAKASVSSLESEAGLSYRFPRGDPRVEWLSADLGFRHEETQTSESDIWKIGLRETRRRHDRKWLETRFIDAAVEDFKVGDDSGHEFLLIPGISWARTVPEIVPVVHLDRGYRITARLSGTTEALGSNAEFLQAELAGKLILPLWPGARFLARAEIGSTLKDEFRELPASVRYFAGGDSSVRGYDYEALGPTDDEGVVIGGSHKVAASIEVDQRVWRDWYLAAFADTGNAVDNFTNLRTKTSIGGGLRWYSPLGPVRLDVAFPLDDDAPDDWRVHVTLGPDL